MIGGDPHAGPFPLDYYVWVIRSGTTDVVVDLGFGAEEAARRGRTLLTPVEELLPMIGVEPERVADVIITHLHYDHAGNQQLFPAARFHIQDREMAFATGRAMRHHFIREPFEGSQVAAMVLKLFDGRVVFHDGFSAFAPGIELHHIGGHTAGLQVVRVHTARGWLVLASDAAHLYANLSGRPFPIVADVPAMLEGHQRLKSLADNEADIIPGHDPDVMNRFAPARLELAGKIVRIA